MIGRYRATGADLPFGDSLPAHGVSMEGYFWRLTDPGSGRTVIALVGISSPARGQRWATVGIAAEPGGILEVAALQDAAADPVRLGVRVGEQVHADAGHARIAVGNSRIDIAVHRRRPWPRRGLGGSSIFQVVPGLNQYWHPWLLGGVASGSVTLDGVRTGVDGWQVYGEKNWGRGGFPESWWWGQSHGFAEQHACVAFAGGAVTAGPRVLGRQLATGVTALVVALPDGRVLRLGNPGTSPMRADIGPGSWRLSGRSRRWQVEVAASADPRASFVLPVPLVEQRRNTPGALEHLAGDLQITVRERGTVLWQDQTSLAGLELGGRRVTEAEVANRQGDRRPRHAQNGSQEHR